jgi:hypothetical protein
LIGLAAKLLHARPVTEEEAEAALAWMALREHKDLETLIAERLDAPSARS